MSLSRAFVFGLIILLTAASTSATTWNVAQTGCSDAIFAETGDTIQHLPWLVQSYSASSLRCEFFGSGFDSGLLEEWDVVVQ